MHRRPPLWLLIPAVPAMAAIVAVGWWAPLAYAFAAPWLVAIAWHGLHGVKIFGDADAPRPHARTS